jgi:hypothetical protein
MAAGGTGIVNDRLHQLAWQFNIAPSSYCHADWLPDGLKQQAAGRDSLPLSRMHRYLSPWLLGEHGLTESFHFDFDQPMTRVALFGSSALQKILCLLGLLRHRDALRRTVERATLAEIGRAAGAEEVRLVRESQADLPLMMHTEGEWNARRPDLRIALWSEGLGLFQAIMPVSSPALTKRLNLKLPRAVSVQSTRIDVLARADRQAIRQWLLERAVPKVEPTWASLLS